MTKAKAASTSTKASKASQANQASTSIDPTYRPPEYLEYLEKATYAIRNVRLLVYAGMTSFVVLALYGFFLIFQLTSDLRRAVDQAELITQQMQAMTRIMSNMSQSINHIDDRMIGMSSSLIQMGDTMVLMQHSANNLDRSIGPTMGMMNSFMPFNGGSTNYNNSPPYAKSMRQQNQQKNGNGSNNTTTPQN